MKSKFNILILEDDKVQKEKLQKAFNKKFSSQQYKIFMVSTVEEFVQELSKRYYLGMSLDHKVPNKEGASAKKYDVSIINRLNKYHALGYKSIYTAFPEWDSAKAFGSTIDYVSKKDLTENLWADKMFETLEAYKTFSKNEDIYTNAVSKLFFPFAQLVNNIINTVDTKHYEKLFKFSIEMFYIVFVALLDKNNTKCLLEIDEQLEFIKGHLAELNSKDTFCMKEFRKVLDENFIDDMLFLSQKIRDKEWSSLDPDCQNYMALLLLRLNFFSAHGFAIKVKTRRNHLRQIEVEAEKIENRAFTTKEYITNFDAIPQNNNSTYLVLKDYNGKSYFLDIGEYLEVKIQKVGSVEIVSKVSGEQIFPLGA
ncbi:MAG TPA: hypothetical protein EYG83_02880 [Sulfurospirillum arcachonense]|nr:hypothetical protein [Sulfurospirillum arcachonense]